MPENNRPKTGRSTRFQPGQSGNLAGRPKGLPNKATREIREYARAILERPGYRQRLALLADQGKLPPHLETLLYHYAYGKPVERMEVVDPRPPFVIALRQPIQIEGRRGDGNGAPPPRPGLPEGGEEPTELLTFESPPRDPPQRRRP